jgi:undecaprenyl diphosphate synthase
MTFQDKIVKDNIPKHISIIMDGNGRWAKKQGKARIFGHRSAIKAVRNATESAAEIGVEYLTLYAFSTENWNRPKFEVDALMELLVNSLSKELPTLQKNKVRLKVIGDFAALPSGCRKSLSKTIEKTSENEGLTLILALSYSSRWEIQQAIKSIIEDAKHNKLESSEFNDDLFRNYLTTKGIPDPELMIRTSGEYRISNFLLWQSAYTEFCFLDKMWPEFQKEDLFQAVIDYQSRERRFGKTSEQI